MKVGELITMLKKFDQDAHVQMSMIEGYPMYESCDIEVIKARNILAVDIAEDGVVEVMAMRKDDPAVDRAKANMAEHHWIGDPRDFIPKEERQS
tara:strand:+ start:2366 stop:2647 length:282 start_codon:yes stop_codon:yes gene_type:complete